MYRIEIEVEADRALRRMPRPTAKRIRARLLALAADPFARNPNIKRLSGREAYRLRIGDWRVLYTIDTVNRVIAVLVVRSRGSAYD